MTLLYNKDLTEADVREAAIAGKEVDLVIDWDGVVHKDNLGVKRCKLMIESSLVPDDWDTIRADFYSKPNCFGRRRKGTVWTTTLGIIEMMQAAAEHQEKGV